MLIQSHSAYTVKPTIGLQSGARVQPQVYFSGQGDNHGGVLNHPVSRFLVGRNALTLFSGLLIAVVLAVAGATSPKRNDPTGAQANSAFAQLGNRIGDIQAEKNKEKPWSDDVFRLMARDSVQEFLNGLPAGAIPDGDKLAFIRNEFNRNPLSPEDMAILDSLLSESPEGMEEDPEKAGYYMDFLGRLGERYLPEDSQAEYRAELLTLQTVVDNYQAREESSRMAVGSTGIGMLLLGGALRGALSLAYRRAGIPTSDEAAN